MLKIFYFLRFSGQLSFSQLRGETEAIKASIVWKDDIRQDIIKSPLVPALVCNYKAMALNQV